mmetsp:Transcript_9808/g.19871  ORF Transcript_9808/g.19871 Transcript_9808/m.19871 type:complete len:84 (+) Transcript_9808:797-1048(+)
MVPGQSCQATITIPRNGKDSKTRIVIGLPLNQNKGVIFLGEMEIKHILVVRRPVGLLTIWVFEQSENQPIIINQLSGIRNNLL